MVPRNKAAETLRKKGKLSVNPLIRLIAPGGAEIGIRHQFQLRQD